MFKPQHLTAFKNKNIRFNNSLQALKSTLSNPHPKVRRFQSDYFLYAKTLITQLQQQLDLNLLKIDFFKSQERQIFSTLKKCSGQEKYLVVLKFTKIYLKLQAAIEPEYIQLFRDSLEYLKSRSNNDSQLVGLIVYERIDEIIVYLSRYIENGSPETVKNRQKIVKKMQSVRSLVEKSTTQKQYGSFLKNISKWEDKRIERRQRKKQMTVFHRRLSKERTSSELSETSRVSNGYVQRLEIFFSEAKNEEFQRHLKILQNSRNKKPRKSKLLSSRKSFNRTNTAKRISTSWQKEQVNYSRSNKLHQTAFKPYNEGKIENEDFFRDLTQNIIASNVKSKKKQQTKALPPDLWVLNISPFYLFAFIHKKICPITVKCEDIRRNYDTCQIVVQFLGFINQKISFKVRNVNLNELASNQELLKKEIIKHLQVRKNGLGSHIQKRSQNNKSEISSFFKMNQTDSQNLSGYVKIQRCYFFTVIKAKILEMYDQGFDKHLMSRNLHSKVNRSSFNQAQSYEEQQLSNDYQPIYSSAILNQGVKGKQIATIKSINKSKMINKYLSRKQKKYCYTDRRECIVDTVRINNHNEIIIFKSEDCSLNLLNIGLSGNNKVLSKIGVSKPSNDLNPVLQKLKETFKKSYESVSSKMRKVSVRMSSSPLCELLYQSYSTKVVRGIGFVVFKIVVFSISSSIVLLDAYIPSRQQIFQFIAPWQGTITKLADTSMNNMLQLKIFVKQMHKKIRPKIKTIWNKIEKFHIQFNSLTIMGKQILIRRFHEDKKSKLWCLEAISLLAKQESLNGPIKFKRQVWEISHRLRNYASEDFVIPSENLFVNFKYLKYQIIKGIQIKSEKEKRATELLKSKDGQKHILRYRGNRSIFHIQSLFQIKQYTFRQEPTIYHLPHRYYDDTVEALGSIGCLKYLKRLIRNQLIFHNLATPSS